MFFTQEDYIKIQQWLSRNSVKDTEFNEANIPFNGNEIVSIVQGNQNKRVFLKDLVSQIFNLGVSDFVNITDKYDAPNISLEEAIRLIPSRARKEGQVITFLDGEDHWHIYQFKGVLNQWNVLDQWKDLFDFNISNFIIDSILPDEGDLTKSLPDANGNSYLSLKDREYNPEDFSGLGRIILRKNIVEVEDPIYGKVKKNIITQDMINKSNTIYEIRYDFDLNGAEITIPEGCVLDFQGGSLNNGTITGNNTDIKAFDNIVIFQRILINGTWIVVNIYSSWFDFNFENNSNNKKNLQNLFNLTSDNFYGNVHILKQDYYLSVDNNGYGIEINSNTSLHLHGRLLLNSNNYTNYDIVRIANKKNITIIGGEIIGDVRTHTGIGGEWGMGIDILTSENILVKDTKISECWGDSIYVGPINDGEDNPAKNVIIESVECHSNRRQGISLTGGHNVIITKCIIHDIAGTSPQCGIDFEPNNRIDTFKNVIVDNCIFYNNAAYDISLVGTNEHSDISIRNCNMPRGVYFTLNGYNISISNSYLGRCNCNTKELYNIRILNNTIDGLANYVEGAFVNTTFSSNIYASSGKERKHIHVHTPTDKTVLKISLPPIDGIYKITTIGGHREINSHFVNEYIFKGRLTESYNNLLLSGVTPYAGDRTNVDIEQFVSYSLRVSNPIKNDNGYYDLYIVSAARFASFSGSLLINIEATNGNSEPYSISKVTTEYIASSEIPNDATFDCLFLRLVTASHVAIRNATPILGQVLFDTTNYRPVYGTGTKWVDATGADV